MLDRITRRSVVQSLAAALAGLGLATTAGAQEKEKKEKKKTGALKFEVYKDAGGDFRWRLKSANGQIVASGQAYSSKVACMRGIEVIKNGAASAKIEEVKE